MRWHLQPLPVGRRRVADHGERIVAAAEPLRGARILHLIAAGARPPVTPPLYRELGINVELAALVGAREIENGLRGAEMAISDEGLAAYREITAELLDGWDVVVSYDLPAAGVSLLRLSVDASAAAAPIRSLVEACPMVVDAIQAIDPLDLPVALAGELVRSLGVDTGRPCCCQLDAFDSWQDPQDVIDAFELAKAELPELQLILAGGGSWGPLREVSEYAQDDVVLAAAAGEVELNAVLQIARVALETSLAPGSVVPALQALWKRTPVISAGSRGAAYPVRDGIDGYLVDTPEQAAERLVELVRDPSLAIELGSSGHELVRGHHLVTRVLEDELALVAKARTATFQSP
jgi:glycosyltransferase involved in cell wall biosynthesis